jgi:hypothetical protein
LGDWQQIINDRVDSHSPHGFLCAITVNLSTFAEQRKEERGERRGEIALPSSLNLSARTRGFGFVH